MFGAAFITYEYGNGQQPERPREESVGETTHTRKLYESDAI
jgi:hypothetical protein